MNGIHLREASISRMVSWAITTGVIVAAFAGIVVGLQGILTEVTGGNTLAVAGSTLAVAALFQPLRRRVQAIVDRRFNRSGYNAQRMVDAFAEHLRSEVDLTTIGSTLLAAANGAMAPQDATVWLHAGAEAEA